MKFHISWHAPCSENLLYCLLEGELVCWLYCGNAKHVLLLCRSSCDCPNLFLRWSLVAFILELSLVKPFLEPGKWAPWEGKNPPFQTKWNHQILGWGLLNWESQAPVTKQQTPFLLGKHKLSGWWCTLVFRGMISKPTALYNVCDFIRRVDTDKC